MEITRRGFLTLSGALGLGVALSSLGVNLGPAKAYAAEINKMQRVMTARQVTTVCCYCSVGCGLICSVDRNTGKIFNIEGDPEHPINEGALRQGRGLLRSHGGQQAQASQGPLPGPHERPWEEKNWDWALDRIARLVKDTRDKGFVSKNAKGEIVNRCETIGHLGSSNVDNEECWLMSVSCRSMGLVYIDHQARV